MRFPPSGFLSPEKLDQLAKLLPESEEEPMDATEDYEEVRKRNRKGMRKRKANMAIGHTWLV